MAATTLTARFCEGVKPVAGRQVAYRDAKVEGLELRVSGEGRKTWSFRYRTKLGEQRRLSLGVFSSEFDLEKARTEAKKARVVVDAGGDPVDTQRAAREAAKLKPIRVFDDLAEVYFKACERGEWAPRGRRKRAVSIASDREVYRLYIRKPLGKLKIETVKRATVKALLRDMVDRGITTRTNRTQAVIGQIFAFGVSEELVEVNPIAGMTKLVPEAPRTRIYSDAELRAMWSGIRNASALKVPAALAAKRRDGDKVFVGPAMRIALQLLLRLLSRRGEVIGMALDELDLEQGVWLIPGERMKSGRPHKVPLSSGDIELIKAALALHEGRQSPYVFPSPRADSKPMGGAAVTHALSGVMLALGIKGGVVHDLRRTGSTLMTSERLGITPFIRSKVLGHKDSGGGASVSVNVYDTNEYLVQKRTALEAWQGLLLEIVGKRPMSSNVSDFRKRLGQLGM